MSGSKPLYTTPIAPLPSTPWIWYLPIFSGWVSGARAEAPYSSSILIACTRLLFMRARARRSARRSHPCSCVLNSAASRLARLTWSASLREAFHALDHHRVQHHVEQRDDQR